MIACVFSNSLNNGALYRGTLYFIVFILIVLSLNKLIDVISNMKLINRK